MNATCAANEWGRKRGPRRAASAAVAGVAVAMGLLLTLAPPALAAYDPLGSGATKLTLDKGFLALLKQNGVKLAGEKPAKVKGASVTFPVSGGKFDPTSAKGTVEHEGALIFKAGARSVPLSALQLKTTQRHAPLSAKAGGGQLKIATAAKLAVSREGFGDKVKVSALALSAKLAERLDKKLHLKGAFKAGQLIGSTLTKAQPQTITVLGKGKASLTFNPETLAKLNGLFVAVNPIFAAEHVGSEFTLQIFGGEIAPDASSGTLETTGSLELLQLGGGQVFFHEPWLDLTAKAATVELDIQPSPPYVGKAGRVAIAALSLIGASVTSNPKARTVSVQNALLSLAPATAATFDEAFAEGKALFEAGEPLGALSFVAQGQ